MSAGASRWLPRHALRAGAALRLFCLPYAGGTGLVFRGWQEALPQAVDVVPVQLPGRGARLFEPAFTRLAPLVHSLGQELRPQLGTPFALFGHSMGALVAFELSRHLRDTYGLEPLALFVSGGRAPDRPDGKRDFLLPDDEFVDMLRRLDGTPEEILDNPEALALLLPTLRADFEVVQTYEYYEAAPLGCRIRAFGGLGDGPTGPDVIEPWSRHTSGSFALTLLPGRHFFIEESRPRLLALLAHETRQLMARARACR